ncbi:MAG: FHA domain-containing protein [Methylacidiphilales bacterium]|nr:FHA domain-containing protein [Candidatus Methylacidiphilales bacterium]MDW8348767.1 FHA domain-containing protein [Verrucomicrobiae bacterium]
MPQLIARSSEFPGLSFNLTQNIHTVGRLEDNDIVIPHPSLSGHHAELSTNGQDYTLTDLSSTNGTYVNEERIDKIKLRSGNIIRFGNVEFLYQSEYSGDGIPLPEPTPFPDLSDIEYKPPSAEYKNLAQNPKSATKNIPWVYLHALFLILFIAASVYFIIVVFNIQL